MVDKMTTVQQLLASPVLIPWIEQRALDYVKQRFVMATRVTNLDDMTGYNDRRISQKKAPGKAQLLSEGVDIPSIHAIMRKRLNAISPSEWGDVYEVTNRRTSTDPEEVLVDVVEALGYSLGRQREEALFAAELGNVNTRLVLSAPTSPYTIDQAVALQTVMEAKAWADSQIYHVIHPYQELDVKLELIKLTNAAVPEFRNKFINQWTYGGFGGLNIAVSGMVPRKVMYRVVFQGTPVAAQIFRLNVELTDTADIAIGAAVANTVTNIQSALDTAVGAGRYTVTAPTSNYNNIRIQSNNFLSEENVLDFGLDANGDPVNNVTGSFRFEEVSAVARAPFFQQVGVIADHRQPVSVYQQWFPRKRTLEIGATEVYGIGPWLSERNGYIETDATSPVAVATP